MANETVKARSFRIVLSFSSDKVTCSFSAQFAVCLATLVPCDPWHNSAKRLHEMKKETPHEFAGYAPSVLGISADRVPGSREKKLPPGPGYGRAQVCRCVPVERVCRAASAPGSLGTTPGSPGGQNSCTPAAGDLAAAAEKRKVCWSEPRANASPLVHRAPGNSYEDGRQCDRCRARGSRIHARRRNLKNGRSH
jgi:hypothetical protein